MQQKYDTTPEKLFRWKNGFTCSITGSDFFLESDDTEPLYRNVRQSAVITNQSLLQKLKSQSCALPGLRQQYGTEIRGILIGFWKIFPALVVLEYDAKGNLESGFVWRIGRRKLSLIPAARLL